MQEPEWELVAHFIGEREPAISELERIAKATHEVFQAVEPDRVFKVKRSGVRDPQAARGSVEQVMEFEVYRAVESLGS